MEVVVSMLFANIYCITLHYYTDIVNRHDIYNYIKRISFLCLGAECIFKKRLQSSKLAQWQWDAKRTVVNGIF